MSMSRIASTTVNESLLLTRATQGSGTFVTMTSSRAGGKPSSPQTISIYSQSDHSILIRDTNVNVDLSDHGNPADRTPITLWGKWSGKNQVWRLEEA